MSNCLYTVHKHESGHFLAISSVFNAELLFSVNMPLKETQPPTYTGCASLKFGQLKAEINDKFGSTLYMFILLECRKQEKNTLNNSQYFSALYYNHKNNHRSSELYFI